MCYVGDEVALRMPSATGPVAVGDEVVGADGNPCRVSHVSETSAEPDLHRVTFADGQTLRACSEHQWVVLDGEGVRRQVSTLELAATSSAVPP